MGRTSTARSTAHHWTIALQMCQDRPVMWCPSAMCSHGFPFNMTVSPKPDPPRGELGEAGTFRIGHAMHFLASVDRGSHYFEAPRWLCRHPTLDPPARNILPWCDSTSSTRDNNNERYTTIAALVCCAWACGHADSSQNAHRARAKAFHTHFSSSANRLLFCSPDPHAVQFFYSFIDKCGTV